jgi:hypothetical protein
VISVTPRVLRAPAVTPRDEEMRPSGTLQSPTTGSLEALILESDREDQIAAARKIPRNSVVQLPDVEPAPFGRAASSVEVARNAQTTPAVIASANSSAPSNSGANVNPQNGGAVRTSTVQSQSLRSPAVAEELPAFVPAPKSLVSDHAAAELSAVNPGAGATQNAILTSLPKPIETAVNNTTTPNARVTQLSLSPANETMKIGDKRRFSIDLKSDIPLGLAVLTLKFDPKVVKLTAVSPGSLLPGEKAPILTQSIDPSGVCLISISALNSAAQIRGAGNLVFIEVEAIGAGDAVFAFDKETMHLVAADARDVTLRVTQGRITVKQ